MTLKLLKPGDNFRKGVRFDENPCSELSNLAQIRGAYSIPGHQRQMAALAPLLLQVDHERYAVHSRHVDVRHNHIRTIRMQGTGAGGGVAERAVRRIFVCLDPVPLALQYGLEQRANHGLIINHGHPEGWICAVIKLSMFIHKSINGAWCLPSRPAEEQESKHGGVILPRPPLTE